MLTLTHTCCVTLSRLLNLFEEKQDLTHKVSVRIKWDNASKASAQPLALTKSSLSDGPVACLQRELPFFSR